MRTWLTGGMIGLAAALAIGTSAVAADDAQRPLTLERVFGSPDLSGQQPRAMKLSPDGKLLTLLKPRADEKSRYDLWARDVWSSSMFDAARDIQSAPSLTCWRHWRRNER